MTRQQIIERILWAIDGYRFGEWSIGDAAARITAVIERGLGGESKHDREIHASRW